MSKPLKIYVIIICVLLLSCNSQKLMFIEKISSLEHKGLVIKENIIEYAVNEISRIKYCKEFSDYELQKMPNLKYRLIYPKVKVSVISESYRLIGYLFKNKEYEIRLDCKKVKVLNKKGIRKLYGIKKLPNYIGSISDTLNLESEFRMEKEADYFLNIQTKGYYPTMEIISMTFNADIDSSFVKSNKSFEYDLFIYDKYKEEWSLKEKNVKMK